MDRRTLLAAGAAAISVMAAPASSTLAQSTPSPEDYVALAGTFYDRVVNGRDFGHITTYLAADYVSLIPTDIPGPDAAAQRLKSFLEEIDAYWSAPPLWTIEETIAQDTRVAIRGRVLGTRSDPAKTNDLYFFGMLRFESALISTSSLLFDRAAL